MDYGYELIVAIWSSVDGLGLYFSDLTGFARSTQGYQLAGSGHDLAEYLIRPLFTSRAQFSERQTLSLAAYTLTNVKAFQSGLVGGDPIILILRNDGTPDIWRKKDFDLFEKSAKIFNAHAQALLLSFIGSDDGKAFGKQLESFSGSVRRQKADWLKEQSEITWASVPARARQLMIDLDVKPTVPRVPQFPTHGR